MVGHHRWQLVFRDRFEALSLNTREKQILEIFFHLLESKYKSGLKSFHFELILIEL